MLDEIKSKLLDMKKEHWCFFEDKDYITIHRPSNIPVGQSDELNRYLKDWKIEMFDKYFGDILQSEVEKVIFNFEQ